MLDVGRKHGVKILDQFVVYRDGNFAGVVEVTQVVDDGMSSARILEGYNVTHPREGDIAVKEPK
jgi:hypothetical protein